METGHGLHFTFDRNVLVLFKTWLAKRLEVFVPVVLTIALVSAYLTATQLRWKQKERLSKKHPPVELDQAQISRAVNVELDQNTRPRSTHTWSGRILNREHLVRSLVRVLNSSLHYFLMLIVMTYCVWFLVAILVGAGFGDYYSFASNDRESHIRSGNKPERDACSRTNVAFQEDQLAVSPATDVRVTHL